MPVTAPRAAGEWAFALHDQAAATALLQRLLGCQIQIELEHALDSRALHGFRLIG